MLRSLRYSKRLLLALDLVVFLVTYQLGHFVRLGRFHSQLLIPGVIGFLPFIAAVFLVFDIYNPWSHYSRMGLATRTFPAIVGLAVVLSLAAYVGFGEDLQQYQGRGVLYLSLLIYSLYVVASRFAFARLYDQGGERSRWLVITEKRFLDPIQNEVHRRFPLWQITYLVVDIAHPLDVQGAVRVLPLVSALDEVLRESWDGVILGTDRLSSAEVELLFRKRLAGLPVMDLVSFYERFFLKVPHFFVEKSWFILGRGFLVLSNPIGLRVKTVTDYLAATFLLLLTWPIMVLIALAVWIDSGRPILFRQERQGCEGRTFRVFKFRTMVRGADAHDPYTQAGDVRITRLGRFLRITRLDELPQLFNILLGQMSLIGPRAEWTKLTKEYEKQIPFYELRHLIRPGITGWAQVMYPYGANLADTVHKLEYDLYYIKNYSMMLDMNIILKTVRVVLFGGGR